MKNKREVHSSSNFFPESAAMNINYGTSYVKNNYEGKGSKRSITCNFMKPGHTANKCYRLIGFPKDFKFTKGKGIVANAIFHNDNEEHHAQ